MTSFGKPSGADRLPRWAETTGQVEDANLTEPSSGQKDTGWALSQVPPSSFENWRANRTYRWLAWLDERFFDENTAGGASQDSFRIELQNGGDFSVVTGAASGEGGDILLDCGDTTGTGSGADVEINAGQASGTDQAGGLVTIRSGQGTGTQGGLIFLQASTGATTGSGANAIESYFVVNGNNENNELRKPLFTNTAGAIIDHNPQGHSAAYTLGGATYRAGVRTVSTSGRSGYLFQLTNDVLPTSSAQPDGAFVCSIPFDDSVNTEGEFWRAFKVATGTSATERFWVNQRGAAFFDGDVGIGVEPSGTPPVLGANLHVHDQGASFPAYVSSTVAAFSRTNSANVCRVCISAGTAAGPDGAARLAFGDDTTEELGYIQYQNSTDRIQTSIGGNEVWRLSSFEARYVSNTSNTADTFYIEDADNTLGRLALHVVGNAGATECLSVDSTGPVGVGTATPSTPFEVHQGGNSITFDPDEGGLQNYRMSGGSQVRFTATTNQPILFFTGTASFLFDENLSDSEFSCGATNASLSLVSVSTRVDPPDAPVSGDLISSSAGFPLGINLRSNNNNDSFYVAFDSTNTSADADTVAMAVYGAGLADGRVNIPGRLLVGATVTSSGAESLWVEGNAVLRDRLIVGSTTFTSSAEIEVKDTDIAAIAFVSTSTSPDVNGFMQSTDASGGAVSLGSASNHPVAILSNNTTRMYFDEGGPIGISEQSPHVDSLLHITETDTGGTGFSGAQLIVEDDTEAAITLMSGNTRNCIINFGDPQDSNAGTIDYDHNNNQMDFRASGGVILTLDGPAQRVGINDSSPDATLAVFGSSTEVAATFHRNTSTDTAIVMEITSNSTDTVNGGAGTSAGTIHWQVDASGQVTSTDGIHASFSDIRMKQKIRPIGDDTLEKLLQLSVIEFTKRDENPEPTHVGVIGQEIKELFPLLSGEVGGYLTVKQTWLPPLIIKAVQQQQELIEKLEARLAALEVN